MFIKLKIEKVVWKRTNRQFRKETQKTTVVEHIDETLQYLKIRKDLTNSILKSKTGNAIYFVV